MRSFPHAWRTLAPRRLFLVDGLGAALSAISLGLVLPGFERAIGLPVWVLYLLALLASGLAVASCLCYWRNPANWRPWLRGIARTNLLYCSLTVVLLSSSAPNLTAWGRTYFGLEMTVIVLLACGELHTASRPSGTRT